MGDLDSLDQDEVRDLEELRADIISYPPEKGRCILAHSPQLGGCGGDPDRRDHRPVPGGVYREKCERDRV